MAPSQSACGTSRAGHERAEAPPWGPGESAALPAGRSRSGPPAAERAHSPSRGTPRAAELAQLLSRHLASSSQPHERAIRALPARWRSRAHWAEATQQMGWRLAVKTGPTMGCQTGPTMGCQSIAKWTLALYVDPRPWPEERLSLLSLVKKPAGSRR